MRTDIISGKSGITVGENSVVGAGSLLNRDVDDGSTVAGVPIKTLKEGS